MRPGRGAFGGGANRAKQPSPMGRRWQRQLPDEGTSLAGRGTPFHRALKPINRLSDTPLGEAPRLELSFKSRRRLPASARPARLSGMASQRNGSPRLMQAPFAAAIHRETYTSGSSLGGGDGSQASEGGRAHHIAFNSPRSSACTFSPNHTGKDRCGRASRRVVPAPRAPTGRAAKHEPT